MYSRKVEGNIAKASSHNLRISVKNAKPVCKSVRGLELKRAKKFLEDVLKEKKSINGRFYSKTTREVLNIILSAEKNAEFKNFDLDNVYIAHIVALEGTHMHRRRRKNKFGTKLKSAHLEVILKEKGKKEGIKEVKKIKEEKQKPEEIKKEVEKEQEPEEIKKEVEKEQEPEEIKKEVEKEQKPKEGEKKEKLERIKEERDEKQKIEQKPKEGEKIEKKAKEVDKSMEEKKQEKNREKNKKLRKQKKKRKLRN